VIMANWLKCNFSSVFICVERTVTTLKLPRSQRTSDGLTPQEILMGIISGRLHKCSEYASSVLSTVLAASVGVGDISCASGLS
jgi:hypothetical protein